MWHTCTSIRKLNPHKPPLWFNSHQRAAPEHLPVCAELMVGATWASLLPPWMEVVGPVWLNVGLLLMLIDGMTIWGAAGCREQGEQWRGTVEGQEAARLEAAGAHS